MHSAIDAALHQTAAIVGSDNVSLAPEAVRYTDSNEEVPNWRQRPMESEPVTVIAAAPKTVSDCMRHFVAEIQVMREREVVRDGPRVRNTASQILGIACGADSFKTTSSSWFSSLGTQHPAVRKLALDMGVRAADLILHAEEALDRRNAAAHPGTLAGLDAEVAEVKQLITPAHEQLYRWECRFIQHYEYLKQAFTEQFQEES